MLCQKVQIAKIKFSFQIFTSSLVIFGDRCTLVQDANDRPHLVTPLKHDVKCHHAYPKDFGLISQIKTFSYRSRLSKPISSQCKKLIKEEIMKKKFSFKIIS